MSDKNTTPATPFNANRLPTLIPGTSGHAFPKPDAGVVACAVPAETTMSTPWGQEMTGLPGKHWHVAQNAEGDHYPNDEFEAYYELGARLSADDDPRAKFLLEYWAERGHEIEVFAATKTKPALVVGVCVEEGQFENVEGQAPCAPGDLILASPDMPDRMWVVRPKVFCKKYIGIAQGTPPSKNDK